jgi:hypothetical protein
LTADVATSGIVSLNEYKYYKFSAPSSFSSFDDIKIAVTATTGDPDLFVSKTNPYPTSAFSTYSGTTIGSDSVTVNYLSWYSATTFYIGVKGTTAATYSVKVTSVPSKFHFPDVC